MISNTSDLLRDGIADTGGNDVVTSIRGGVVGSQHHVHAAVVDPTGKLLFMVGNAQRMTLARSATKPIQALAILETGAAEIFDDDDVNLLLMCASHSNGSRLVERARAMLKKMGAREGVLTCDGIPL
jgi:L-asparaginase II